MIENAKTQEDKWLCYFMWTIGFVLIVMLISVLCIFRCIDSWEHRGQFGDLFGVVNALFSGLAFAGLIITIRQQHKDLEYQRTAIHQTNLEMQSQTVEFEKQNDTLKQEQFESTFFKMLEVQQSIVNDLYASDSHKERVTEDSPNSFGTISKEVLAQDVYRGRNLFYYIFMCCEHEVDSVIVPGKKYVLGLYQVIKLCGKSHFDDYMTTTAFDHYFTHLYAILQFIDKNKWLGDDDQYQYASFVRATLSRYELVMLYYYGLFHKEMKHMLERYCMLSNLRKYLLPMCREYSVEAELLGITREDLKEAGFSIGDFEYYLTESKDDESKYYLSAFYSPKELYIGEELVQKWQSYMKKNITNNE